MNHGDMHRQRLNAASLSVEWVKSRAVGTDKDGALVSDTAHKQSNG